MLLSIYRETGGCGNKAAWMAAKDSRRSRSKLRSDADYSKIGRRSSLKLCSPRADPHTSGGITDVQHRLLESEGVLMLKVWARRRTSAARRFS